MNNVILIFIHIVVVNLPFLDDLPSPCWKHHFNSRDLYTWWCSSRLVKASRKTLTIPEIIMIHLIRTSQKPTVEGDFSAIGCLCYADLIMKFLRHMAGILGTLWFYRAGCFTPVSSSNSMVSSSQLELVRNCGFVQHFSEFSFFVSPVAHEKYIVDYSHKLQSFQIDQTKTGQ